MELRDYREEDHEAVLRLNVVALHPELDWRLETVPEDLRDIVLSFADGAFLVGYEEGLLVAMGSVKPGGDGLFEVNHIEVEAAYRRRGFGTQLMRALEARAAALGATGLVLDTTIEQVPAQRLYESLGYEFSHNSTIQGQTREYHLIHYRKSLLAPSGA